MESLVPDKMKLHFEAAKSAKLLTVQGMDEAGCGWLVVRLVGDWLRRCVKPNDEHSDIAVVLFSLHNNFDYYANNLAHFGIDLKRHEEMGHFKYLGNMYTQLLGDNTSIPAVQPTTTLEAAMDLLCDWAGQLGQTHTRTVLIMDAPELTMPLFEAGGNRTEQWLTLVQSAAYQFNHAILSLMLTSPQMGRTRAEFEQTMASIHGVTRIMSRSDMTAALRGSPFRNTQVDGTIRFAYRRDYEPPRPDLHYEEEGFAYKVKPDGRSVEIVATYT